jgi:hypothetical protein
MAWLASRRHSAGIYGSGCVIVVVMALTACGGGGSTAASSTPLATTATAAPTQTAAPKTVPTDLCSLLTPSDLQSVLGRSFISPIVSGADTTGQTVVHSAKCNYGAPPDATGQGGGVIFIVYQDPSVTTSTQNFAAVKQAIISGGGSITVVNGVGDEAFLETTSGGLFVRHGEVRFVLQIALNLDHSVLASKEQTLASIVLARL